MKDFPAVIFASDLGWKIGRGDSIADIPFPADGGMDAVAAALAALPGMTGAPAILALPSEWCLCAAIALAGIPNRNRRRTLLYKLELLLPISIEDITADYLFDEPDTALAVCVQNTTVKPLIDAIETAGIDVRAIVPASLWAVRWLLARPGAADCDAVVWQSDSALEIWPIRNGKIAGWSVFPPAGADLAAHLRLAFPTESKPARVIAVNLSAEMIDGVTAGGAAIVERLDSRPVDRAVMSAVADQIFSPIDLRRDGLASRGRDRNVRRTFLELGIAAAVLAVCICAAACLRAARLERAADASRDQQAALFRGAFPGRAVPPNITARLRSERRALTGPDGAAAATAQSASAMPTIKTVLTGIAALPSPVRVQIQDFRTEDASFSIEGTAKSRADLTALTDALDQTGRLQTSPAQTESVVGGGIHFVLEGNQKSQDKPR